MLVRDDWNSVRGPAGRCDRLVPLVRGGRRALPEVSLAVEPRRLVAVIGVRDDGAALCSGEPGLGKAGVNPQDDIVHPEPPPATMLRDATRLRLPSVMGRDDLRVRADDGPAFSGSPERARIRFGVATIQEVYPASATLPESSALLTASPAASSTAGAEPGSVPARSIPAGPAIGPMRQALMRFPAGAPDPVSGRPEYRCGAGRRG
jgi:hypothetical protein